jgi:N-acetylmuramoyl-L-alanine amidase
MNLRFGVFSLAALLMAIGCAGPGRKVTPLVSEQAPRPAPIVEVQETPSVPTPTPEREPETTPPPVEAKPEPKPVVVEPVEIKPVPPPSPITGLISLQEWCKEHGLAQPQISREANQTNIVVRSDNGVFSFELPRRNARWNGILLGVAAPPVFTNHQTLVSAIDLNKVLQPLLLTNDAPRKQGGIVVIDPGHGGSNEGALSHDRKYKEKTFTLDWARRVEKLLEGSRWKVVLTRTNDADVRLTNRVAIAETNKADLFISLHFNSFTKPAEAGLETYCMTPQGMVSHVTRTFADDVKEFVPNNEFDAENFLLAYDMQRAMLRKTGRPDRGVRRARFMTALRDQKRPAVLLEGGYLSNPEEGKLIATPEYRQKLAEAVAEALGVKPPTLTTLRK